MRNKNVWIYCFLHLTAAARPVSVRHFRVGPHCSHGKKESRGVALVVGEEDKVLEILSFRSQVRSYLTALTYSLTFVLQINPSKVGEKNF